MAHFLGLDLGTSGLKALLIDEEQTVVGEATAPLSVARPHTGWSEQSPADWIAAAEAAIDRLQADHADALACVAGIGLSGQMHGATLIGRDDRVLRPCILWNDTRSHREAARLDGDARFRAITGNIVFPGFTAPKLLWVAQHEPDIFSRLDCVLLPKDFLRLWLTGERVGEMSDAAGTAWLDTAGRDWSDELLRACSLTRARMPRLVEGTAVSGRLRPALCTRWGIATAPVVAGGAGDNAASGVGCGVIADGSAFVSLGTSGVLFAATARYQPNPASAVHAFCHALPGTWHQMGVILSAAAALEWLAGVLREPAATLTAALGNRLQPPGQIRFLPYLSGERTPHNDARIRGVMLGIGHETDRAALTRAVLEGVAFALRDNLEALRRAGSDPRSLIAVGGGSRAGYWLEAIATALDLPIQVPAEGDFGAAFGAARLGLIAGRNADPAATCFPPAIERVIEPSTALRASFAQAYADYRAAYAPLAALAAG